LHLNDRAIAAAVTAGAVLSKPRAFRKFRRILRYWPRVALPRTYNEKMLWRRLFDRNPAFVQQSDKLAVKDMFRALDDPIDVSETLWTGTRPEDFPDDLWRDDVVVKHSAGSGRNWVFAQRKEDREAFNRTLRGWMDVTYGQKQGEWAYRDARKVLFAERMVADDPRKIEEIKVHLFGGEVFYAVLYRGEKTENMQSAIFDADGTRLAVTTTPVVNDPSKALPPDYELPGCFARAIHAARTLAKGMDYIRVDFMVAGGMLYGGEMTHYPTGGLMGCSDQAVLDRMGETWDLRQSWFMQHAEGPWQAPYRDFLDRHLPRADG